MRFPTRETGFYFCLLVVCAATPIAANSDWCGTPSPTEDFLKSISISYPYTPTIGTPVIKVRVHDLRSIEDPNTWLSSSTIDDIMSILAEAFDGVVEYQILGVFEQYSTDAAFKAIDWINPSLPEALNDEHGGDDALDIFLGWIHSSDAGAAVGVPSTACVVTGPNHLFNKAVAHEVGHCLGLYHTFESDLNCADHCGESSDCASCGDLVCDTLPNPMRGLRNYVDGETCALVDSFYTQFPDCDPDPTNIMAYTKEHCWSSFTPEQCLRMLAMIEHSPLLQAVVDHPVVALQNHSAETGLDYTGQPYSVVGFDYRNEDGQDRDFEDLLVTQYGEDVELFI